MLICHNYRFDPCYNCTTRLGVYRNSKQWLQDSCHGYGLGRAPFWNQKDCEVNVAAGASGSCRTPTGICPKWFKYDEIYQGRTRTIECGPGLPMCRSLDVKFVDAYGYCKVENWSDCHEVWVGL